EAIDPAGEDVMALLIEAVHLQRPPGPGSAREGVAPEAALHRPGREQDLPLDAGDLRVPPLGDGYGHDPLAHALEVDAQWRRAGGPLRLGLLLVALFLLLGRFLLGRRRWSLRRL